MPVTPRAVLPAIQSRGLLLVVLLAVIIVVTLVALRGGDGGGLRPAEGGTLVESSIGPVERVNPLLARSPAERDVAALVFAGLTRVGPAGEAAPDVAESWDVSDDGRTITFTLRRDLSWHDGAALRVEDVLFTVRLIQAGVAADQRLVDVWKSATATRLDERRVRVTMPAPFSPLPAYAGFGLLPEHLLRDVEPSQLGSVPFNRRPVGLGPFRLRSLDEDRARLVRYDRYHLGAPYLDAIEVELQEAAPNADAVVLGPGVTPGERVVYPVTEQAYAVVMLNNDSPLFATDTVRRALSLALDRRALVSRTLGGRGAPTDVPFAPGSWAHDGIEPLPPNVDLAKSLLAAAGWEPGPDGVLRRANRELRFTLVTADEPVWAGIARVLADSWQQIGARVTVAPTPQTALMGEFLNPRQYEAALIGWDPGLDPDPFTAWHSSLRGVPGSNPANFADEQTDMLLVAGRLLGREEERGVQYAAFQARFRELAPSIVLFTEIVRYAVRDDLQLSLPASAASPEARYSDVRRWFLTTRHGP
jgi:peptide/nickel transport system substrate-binding protein